MLRIPRNQYSGLRIQRFKEQEQLLAESRLNGGMVTIIDPADIENNQFYLAKNVTNRYDKLSRRQGIVTYPVAAPNANMVLMAAPFTRYDRTSTIIRATPTTIHSGNLATWTAIAGTLSGGASDHFLSIITQDRFFFVNNGADYIQEVNLATNTFGRLGNADKYKYLTVFNNRLVGANLAGASASAIQIGWSGDLNFGVWDSITDLSAGNTPLVETPAASADPITGIFAFTENGLVLRERSVYGMVKQPIASAPFAFFAIIPNIGCDAPYTAVRVSNGVAWYDSRTSSVYVLRPGMTEPEAIGRPVERSILNQISNLDTMFANYDNLNDEYVLCIPGVSTYTQMWTYNFRSKAWVYDEIDHITSMSSVEYAGIGFTIDQLIGPIDSLTTSIDGLASTVKKTLKFFGTSTGELLGTLDDTNYSTDNGIVYPTEIISKIYTVPSKIGYIVDLKIEFTSIKAGYFDTWYSKNGGLTWILYKRTVIDVTDIGKRKLATFMKNIKCAQYQWRITSDSGQFDLIDYKIRFIASDAETRAR